MHFIFFKVGLNLVVVTFFSVLMKFGINPSAQYYSVGCLNVFKNTLFSNTVCVLYFGVYSLVTLKRL